MDRIWYLHYDHSSTGYGSYRTLFDENQFSTTSWLDEWHLYWSGSLVFQQFLLQIRNTGSSLCHSLSFGYHFQDTDGTVAHPSFCVRFDRNLKRATGIFFINFTNDVGLPEEIPCWWVCMVVCPAKDTYDDSMGIADFIFAHINYRDFFWNSLPTDECKISLRKLIPKHSAVIGA